MWGSLRLVPIKYIVTIWYYHFVMLLLGSSTEDKCLNKKLICPVHGTLTQKIYQQPEIFIKESSIPTAAAGNAASILKLRPEYLEISTLTGSATLILLTSASLVRVHLRQI